MRKRTLAIIVGALALYIAGYGLARWRKFIVMQEYHLKERALVVRETGTGLDVRDNWKGHLKNTLSPAVFFCFRPLCAIEDHFRGGTRPRRSA